jgi:hypothetical protein
MLDRMLLQMPACLCVLLVGCAQTDHAELTAAAAKDALVAMMEHSDDSDLQLYLEPLKKSEPKVEDDGTTVKFGPMTCYLPKRRFILFIVFAESREFIEWTGTFFRKNNRWFAEVEEKQQT